MASDGPAQRRRKLGLKAVLAGLILITAVDTAFFVHLVWSRSARENVADVARQLNQEIVDSIRHELRGVLDEAVAAQRAVGSIFANGTIAPEDEAKRDFIFLALLRAQPNLSWISLGTPEGDFFGAQRLGENQFDLVSVRKDAGGGGTEERRFHFEAAGLEMVFHGGETHPSSYNATAQEWYRRAVRENGPGWNSIARVPGPQRAAISSSTPLIVNTQLRGVINVVIELERLSQFLKGLSVGKTGTVVLIDRAGHIVASPDPRAVAQQQEGRMPMLEALGAGNPLLALVDRTIGGMKVDLRAVTKTRQLAVTGPDGDSYYITFEPLQFQGWIVATVIPAADFLASIEKNARSLLAALAAVTLVITGIGMWLTNRLVARPLARVVDQLRFIESFRLDQVRHAGSWLREFDGLSQALLQMSRGLASFQRYMPTELVRTLVSRGIEARPGGSQEYLTVLFADLAGFTSLSEMLGEAVMPVLTDYLETSSSAVIAHRGTIDKFIGDAVMAFWGAPIENPAHARDACAAALACVGAMAARCAALPAEDPRGALRVRIGINTGRMLVGNVGSAERLNYTVIGDPVNVASRLEALNKRYGTAILIGEETRRAADEAIRVRELDRVAVYGRAEGIAVYELLAMTADTDETSEPFAWVKDYEAGLAAYRARRWEEARHLFTAAKAARDGGDRPSEIFIERCRALLADPPGADWSPVAVLLEK